MASSQKSAVILKKQQIIETATGPLKIQMNRFIFFSKLLLDQNGQGTVEYLVILSASAVGAIQLGKKILLSLDNGILFLGAQLERDLKTGRAPLDVWQN